MMDQSKVDREFLRHTLATLAYRGSKVVRDAPPEFADYRVAEESRTPAEILTHIGDLLDWAVQLAGGRHHWQEAIYEGWNQEVGRFFTGLRRLDEVMASEAPLGFPAEKLFQGPIADALTHVGQLAMLRRLCGAPIRGENYFKAEIRAGQVGQDQEAPRLEFE